jgi:hypothetical protein
MTQHRGRLRGKPARPTGQQLDRVSDTIEGETGAPAPPPRRLLTGARLWGLGVALITLIGGFAYYHVADPELTGDEPHYIVFGRSLAEGWGIDLTRAYEPENYRPFYGGELEPHAHHFAGKGSRLASWHGIGLPLLLAPALKVNLSVWTGRWVMLLIWTLLGYHLFRLVLRVTGATYLAAAIAVVTVALAPPLIFYSAQVFPEIPAALLVVVALRALLSDARSWVRLGGASVAATLLLWLNPRYATLTLVLLVITAVVAVGRYRDIGSMLRSLSPVILPALVIGVSLIAFNVEVFAGLVPGLEVASLQPTFFKIDNLYRYGIGGVIGTPAGVIPHGPILLLALVAVPIAARVVGAYRVVAVSCLGVAYAGLNAYFGYPGWAPPGRYFVSVVPLLAVPLAVVVAWGGRIARAALGVLGAFTVLATVTSAHNFDILYTNGTRHLQPIDATADLYPFAPLTLGLSTIRTPAQNVLHQVGELELVQDTSMLVARSPRDPPGALVYGPYETLQPGQYVARFSLWGGEGPQVAIGTVDVVEVAGDVLAQRSINTLPSTLTRFDVPFTAKGDLPLEMRVFFAGGALGVESVEALLIDPLPARGVGDEVWKAVLWIGIGIGIAVLWAKRSSMRNRPPRPGERPRSSTISARIEEGSKRAPSAEGHAIAPTD